LQSCEWGKFLEFLSAGRRALNKKMGYLHLIRERTGGEKMSQPNKELIDIKAKFDAWRAARGKRGRIPEQLWELALSLVDRYPLTTIVKELHLNMRQLKLRLDDQKAEPAKAIKTEFLEITTQQIDTINSKAVSAYMPSQAQGSRIECKIVLKKVDGNKLKLRLPIEWQQIESLCNSFLRQ
jgi:hypothetical protein